MRPGPELAMPAAHRCTPQSASARAKGVTPRQAATPARCSASPARARSGRTRRPSTRCLLGRQRKRDVTTSTSPFASSAGPARNSRTTWSCAQACAGVLPRLDVRREPVVGQRHVEDGALRSARRWHPRRGLDRDRSALRQSFERYLGARRLRANAAANAGRAAPVLPLREIPPLHQNLRRIDEARAIRTHSSYCRSV